MLATALLLALALPGGDDILCLTDGRVIEGLSIQQSDQGYLVSFDYGDLVVPDELVLDCIFADPPPPQPRNEEEREKYEKGFVLYDGKWITDSRRDKLRRKRLEQQRDLVEDIRHTSLWRNRIREETRNFAFEATVPRPVFESYRDQMEAYFQAFMKYWKVKPPKGLRLKVCFYGDQEKYLQVTGVSSNTLGYFRFVEPYELNIFYDRLAPRDTEEIMYHEANHYLQKLIDVGFKYPHWPGEALAEYYAGTRFDPDKGKLSFGHVLDGRLTQVQQDILLEKRVTLRELIENGPERTFHDYTWGWTLVHYLLETPKYEKNFRKYYSALAMGKDIDRSKGPFNLDVVSGEEMMTAFQKYMKLRSDEDLDELQAGWYAHIDELEVSGTRGLEKAAQQAVRNGQTIKAKRLFQEAIAAGARSPLTYHRYANLLHEEEDYDLSIAAWMDAVALDPLTATYWVMLGRALMDRNQGDDVDEGMRLLQLANEIDPDDTWLKRNLARMLKEYERRQANQAKEQEASSEGQ